MSCQAKASLFPEAGSTYRGHLRDHAFEVGKVGLLAPAETRPALEDTRPGGHVALETPGPDANLEHQVKLNISKGLVSL